MIGLWLLRWVLVLCFDAANLACVLALFSHKGFVHASFLTVFVPQKTALKKMEKLCKIYWKIELKIDDIAQKLHARFVVVAYKYGQDFV